MQDPDFAIPLASSRTLGSPIVLPLPPVQPRRRPLPPYQLGSYRVLVLHGEIGAWEEQGV